MSTEPDHSPEPAALRAHRGLEVRCRGWRQEGLLRMLENTVEIGERPEELIIYAATGQAARNWDCYREIERQLLRLDDDETLVVQSGKPVAVFRTTPQSPRVVIANTNYVGSWANWETFYELRSRGLAMFGQYTAGAWQYIGQQGILQSTYETLALCARTHFGPDLTGRIFLSGGLGAMGGAQPLAAKFLGAAAMIVEVDDDQADRRIRAGYLDRMTQDIDEAIAAVTQAANDKDALSIGLIGNTADVMPELLKRNFHADVMTDQTSAHDLRHGYIPSGLTVQQARALREADPHEYERRAQASVVRHVEAMLGFKEQGSVVFEYGNAIRQAAASGGLEAANGFEGFVQLYIRPSFCRGRGPCRWVCLSGDPDDLEAIDAAMLEKFRDDESVTGWISIAMERVPLQGLPARTSWLDPTQRGRFASMVNELVATGGVSAPVAMSRDHLDAGSVSQPTRETERMRDGTDGVADWPLLNALLNTSAGADLVAIHQGGGSGMGGSISAGVTLILDGTPEAHDKALRVLAVDPGIGVIRHADAGYPEAIDTVQGLGLRAPMIPAM